MGFTSKLAARIHEEGTLEDKGPSGSSKGHSGQSLLTRYTFSVTTAHFLAIYYQPTLLLLLLTGTIFSYFCMSSITSVLILAILIAIVLF